MTIALAIVVAAIALRDEPAATEGAPAAPTADGPRPEALGLDWREASSVDLVGPGDQKILGGVPTSTGFIAFGYTTTEAENPDGVPDLDTAVWVGTSDDRWSSIPPASFVESGNQRATDAIVFGDDAIVLVSSADTNEDFDAAAWLLPSGSTTWGRVDVRSEGLDRGQDQFIKDAVQSGNQLYAVGYTKGLGDEDAAVWQSQRGELWKYEAGAVSQDEGSQRMATVVLSPEELLVVGGFVEEDGDRDAAVWILRTGSFVHGRKDPDLRGRGDQQINAITLGGPGFVAVGEETIHRDTNAVVWVSTDARDWSRVDDSSGTFGGEGAQRMYAVTSSPLGIVAAGSDRSEGDVVWDAAVWTSIDGVEWDRLPGDNRSMTTLTDVVGDQQIQALIPLEDGFLALGAEKGYDDWDARVRIGTRIS